MPSAYATYAVPASHAVPRMAAPVTAKNGPIVHDNDAIAKVNNTDIVDRPVRVNEAQERPPRR